MHFDFKNMIGKITILTVLILLCFQSIAFSNLTESKSKVIELPNDESIGKIVELINDSRKKLYISMYRVENDDIIDSIIKAKNRGVDVKIVLCNYNKGDKFYYDQYYNKTFQKLIGNKKTFDVLSGKGIEVIFSNQNAFLSYHSKFLVIDDSIAMIGTSNFNNNGFFNARNFFVVTKDRKIVLSLSKLFYNDFNLKKTKWMDNNIAVSPGNYLEKIYEVINSAKKEIYIYQTMLGHKGICDKLSEVANSGINIEILTSKRISHKSKESEVPYCEKVLGKNKNISLKYLNEPYYIHAKVIISDPKQENRSCFIGSSLFWDEGFAKSRETGIVILDKDSILKIYNTFMYDFSIAVKKYEGNVNLD